MDYISSTNVNDVVPKKRGREAFAAFCEHPRTAKSKLDDAYTRVNNILSICDKSGAPELAPIYNYYASVLSELDSEVEECEEEIISIRKWCTECMAEMKDKAPEMTGKLKDSIRIMGTGPLDYDVDIDIDEISKPTKMKNTVPYVKSYDKWLKGEEAARDPGSVTISSEGNYAGYANGTARPKDWWKGGTTPLIGFWTQIWEVEIKKAKADQLGLSYEVNLDKES